MKFLQRLEKTTLVWLLIAFCLVFSLLRLPSLIEPSWYGDEGIYEVIGQSMNQGQLLYRDTWDNKPPLLYVVYALSQGDQPTIKAVSLVVGLLTIIAFFFLSQKLFNKQKISVIITSLFVILLATPLLEANIANAEDFILLPIICAGLLIYQTTTNKIPKRYTLNTIRFFAGLLLGIAFMFKTVVVFDLAAFVLFFIFSSLPENVSWLAFRNSLKQKTNYYAIISHLRPLIIGFLVPFLLAFIYFAINHALKDFLQSSFFGNVDYVGWKNNLFGIPQGWLVLKCLFLLGSVFLIFRKRKYISEPVLFILLWLVLSVFNVFFSGRPYTHYVLVLLPSFLLFIGLLFKNFTIKTKLKIFVGVLILLGMLSYKFSFDPTRSFSYYQNVLLFISNQKSIENYQSFFDEKVPRDYTVATFIASHTTRQDSVFIWGNNPQIYALSHKIPVGKYTVAYHISQNNGFDETQQAINKVKPKYIIVLTESQPLPFVIPLYIMRYNIAGATIYERSF